MCKSFKMFIFLTMVSAPFITSAKETYSYLCGEEELKVAFPDKDHAVIYYEGKLSLLNIALSASGARYLGDGWELWTAKDDVTLTKVDKKNPKKDYFPKSRGIDCLNK